VICKLLAAIKPEECQSRGNFGQGKVDDMQREDWCSAGDWEISRRLRSWCCVVTEINDQQMEIET
jgi:hypothetical protein